MKKQHPEAPDGARHSLLWTHAKAQRAVPYLRLVLKSVRDHWLALQQARRELQRIDGRPGRPDRETLVLRGAIEREARSAEEQVDEALNELLALGVYPLNAAMGLALIPFRQGDDLAWLIFDSFEPQGLMAWRFDTDPSATRRSFDGPTDTGLIDAIFSRRGQRSEGVRQGGEDAAHNRN
jgi:hypothetical protein